MLYNRTRHNDYHLNRGKIKLIIILIRAQMEGQLYKDLPNGCYELREAHIPDVCELMVDAFILNNQIWSSANLRREELHSFFLNVLRQHLSSQETVRTELQAPVVLNFIYILNGKLVSVLMHYEIDEYRKKQAGSKPSEIPLFRELEREGRELIKCVDLVSMVKGKHIYCTWAAHYPSPDYKQQHKVEQVAQIYDRIRVQGFEGMVCRSSNLRVVQILYPLGGELLKETIFSRGGKDFKLYFAMLHLQNDLLGQFIENVRKMKEEVTPKL